MKSEIPNSYHFPYTVCLFPQKSNLQRERKEGGKEGEGRKVKGQEQELKKCSEKKKKFQAFREISKLRF